MFALEKSLPVDLKFENYDLSLKMVSTMDPRCRGSDSPGRSCLRSLARYRTMLADAQPAERSLSSSEEAPGLATNGQR